jgi:L-rhamnose mutarotase
MKRMAMVIELRADKVAEYKRLHADVWPAVMAKIAECNIRNYSIFLREPENLLFGYWEYHGSDFATDARRMAEDEATQRWWALCEPCQRPFDTRTAGKWWASMEEVFHID